MKIKKTNIINFVLFLLPIMTIFTINVVGELMFSDILVLFILIILIISGRLNFRQPCLKKIILFLFLWLISAIISDILNGTSIKDMTRGIAMIIFFGFYLIVFFNLIDGKKSRYTIVIVSIALSYPFRWITGNSIFSSYSIFDVPWKMGVGFGITIIFVTLIGKWIKNERILGKIVMILSPIHLFLNARSLFLITFLSGFINVFRFNIYSKKKRFVISTGILFLFFSLSPIVMNLYGEFTKNGFFGEEARLKYIQQSANGHINILIGGRSESLISIKAISDAPLFGHGSWAKSRKYYFMYLSTLESIGKNVNWDMESNRKAYLIPTHSILFGSWVYHGFFAGIFWLYILFLDLKVLNIAIVGKKAIPIRELLVLLILFWDILFSPFGQARRCIEAAYIVTMCIILRDIEKNSNLNNIK